MNRLACQIAQRRDTKGGPDIAGELRTRKLDAAARARASVVASANPGCALHLAAGGARVRHPVELVAEAIGVGEGAGGGG